LVLSLTLAAAGCINGTVSLDNAGPPLPDGAVVVTPDGGRVPDGGGATVITFGDVQPMFTRYTCTGCHNATTKTSSYSVASYADVIGGGAESAQNVIPGNANSPLLLKIKGPPPHQNNTWTGADLQKLTDWIVLNNARQN
jgi:hypothetical protein